jgi:hypothetical protein
MPMTINIVMKDSVARRVSVRKRQTLAPSKEQRDAKESQKNGRLRKSVRTSAAVRACSKPVQAQGIEFMNNNLGIAVILGARHDAEVVIA